jgi:hypothetical protein
MLNALKKSINADPQATRWVTGVNIATNLITNLMNFQRTLKNGFLELWFV